MKEFQANVKTMGLFIIPLILSHLLSYPTYPIPLIILSHLLSYPTYPIPLIILSHLLSYPTYPIPLIILSHLLSYPTYPTAAAWTWWGTHLSNMAMKTSTSSTVTRRLSAQSRKLPWDCDQGEVIMIKCVVNMSESSKYDCTIL